MKFLQTAKVCEHASLHRWDWTYRKVRSYGCNDQAHCAQVQCARMEVYHNQAFRNVHLDHDCHFAPSLEDPVLSPCILSVEAVCTEDEHY